ncbi:hypothetical protein E7Z57_22180 (plasmid) [Ralstonia pseudosolanacearum]|uniref:Integrase catalytic domain-containing protein n=1 Tax=Ralstonia solanacearum TaxID=305 RepID=A0AA92EIQ3_RALSL|nr:hypothetical protein E7Z57_22180 [Ralstonia pseudosolanacearum]
MDKWAGRDNESHDRGSDRQALPLETHRQLENHLRDFIQAYNFARRLKRLKGLTPYEYVCKISATGPERFTPQPAPSNAGTKHPAFFTESNFIFENKCCPGMLAYWFAFSLRA